MSGTESHKLLFINHWAERLGGAEFSLMDIMVEAAKRAEVFLVTSESGFLIEKAGKAGIKCKIISCNKNIERFRREHLLFEVVKKWKILLSYLNFIWQLHKYVVELKPDIIHANIPKSHIAAALLSILGYKGILIFHIREIFKKRSLITTLYRFLLPRGSRTRVIAISNAVKMALPHRIEKKSVVLYNGIDVPDTIVKQRNEDTLRFLYLGRIVPWKGCHFLIDAFNEFNNQHDSALASLDLVGDTLYWDQSYRNELVDKINQLKLTDKIRIFPHTENPQETYCSHDVLCMSSDNEPFGRVAAEGMGFGLPVISFHSGGVSEIVINNVTGFLIESNNIENYAAAMGILFKDRLLVRNMGRAGHKLAKEKFNRTINIPVILDYMLN